MQGKLAQRSQLTLRLINGCHKQKTTNYRQRANLITLTNF